MLDQFDEDFLARINPIRSQRPILQRKRWTMTLDNLWSIALTRNKRERSRYPISLEQNSLEIWQFHFCFNKQCHILQYYDLEVESLGQDHNNFSSKFGSCQSSSRTLTVQCITLEISSSDLLMGNANAVRLFFGVQINLFPLRPESSAPKAICRDKMA
jgi:hypothetical protein